MVATTEKRTPVKMAGYLEKKGKMRMVCRWKRLWFVLKGRLLHYYKSQMDYINLSPCHGSLNMGIAASVHPGKGLELQIFTRSQTIILRAVNKQEHEQWLQALVDAMAQQDFIQPNTGSLKPVQHFRYSSNEVLYSEINDRKGKSSSDKGSTSTKQMAKYKKRNEDEDEDGSSSAIDDTLSLLSKSTVSNFGTCLLDHCPYRYRSGSKQGSSSKLSEVCTNAKQNIVNRRLERLTLSRPNGVTNSDTSIPASLFNHQQIFDQNALLSLEEKCQSLKELRLSCNDENLNGSDIGLKSLKDKDICFSSESRKTATTSNNNSQKSSLVNRSESLSSLRNKIPLDKKQLQEMKILIEGKTVYGSSDSVYKRTASEESRLLKGNILYKRDVEKILARRLGNSLCENKEIKSDTDLSRKNIPQTHSGSCGQLSTVKEKIISENDSVHSREFEIDSDGLLINHSESILTTNNEALTQQSLKNNEGNSSGLFHTKLRSPLGKLLKDGENSESARGKGLERKGTLKKRSLSFLRRMWKWKEEKAEQTKTEKKNMDDGCEGDGDIVSADSNLIDETTMNFEESKAALLPEPPPDYDLHPVEDDDEAPTLPPRTGSQRSNSPWHDVPKNNKPICPAHENDDQPPPLPIKTRKSTGSCTESSYHSNSTSVSGFEGALKFNLQFDSLEGVSDSVFGPELSTTKQENVDESPVYDVPRMLGSLILRKESLQDSLIPTHFLNNNNPDIRKVPTNSFEEDSLDVNPALWRAREIEQNFTPDSLECDNIWTSQMGHESFHMTWSKNIEEKLLTKPFFPTREKPSEQLPNKGQDLPIQEELATN